ncbi:hypothetical protein ILUMI_00957 [Ignelater luminosus]|uniref:Reverse transcriptase domain-containing protein n=1 Tax=Ignelater luminosus TaxID=2038154 RepID=A0A8K0GPQ0_IGNLU|nr:hypothetical protein ILUMI_00957 [Ignelater luminosus]
MSLFTNEEMAIIAIALDENEEDQCKVKERKWVHEACQKRETEAEFHTLYKKLLNGQRNPWASRLCAMVTVDVKNAFKSANWTNIVEELDRRTISPYLINVIQNYLQNRCIIIKNGEENKENVKVNSGVPQGSVLGLLLLNIPYDGVLQIPIPGDVVLIGFADDLAVVATAKKEEALQRKLNTTLDRLANWMREN